VHHNRILAMYPMHEPTVSNVILEHTMEAGTVPWKLPAFALKEYFGEKISLNIGVWCGVVCVLFFCFLLLV
jgi:hypothetical protein